MAVYLRERQLKGNRTRYFLDIYISPGNRYYEFLFVTKNGNRKEKKKLAEAIRSQRELEILSKGTAYTPPHLKNLRTFDFLDNYVRSYKKKDIKVIRSAVKHFKGYFNSIDQQKAKNHQIKELNRNDVKQFNDYLVNEAGLSGVTPKTYFKRFKKVIRSAVDRKLLDEEVVKVSFNGNTKDTLTKEVLNEAEINKLQGTECGNNEVKKAFLFSCYSGIGLKEAQYLKWSNINNGKLLIDRAKNDEIINIRLSPTALEIIGERKEDEELVFDLKHKGKNISPGSVNKTLKVWVKNAGIKKHITFYCGRHTYAVRLLLNGSNLKTVADALGHTSTKHTTKYLNFIDSLKDEATSNL